MFWTAFVTPFILLRPRTPSSDLLFFTPDIKFQVRMRMKVESKQTLHPQVIFFRVLKKFLVKTAYLLEIQLFKCHSKRLCLSWLHHSNVNMIFSFILELILDLFFYKQEDMVFHNTDIGLILYIFYSKLWKNNVFWEFHKFHTIKEETFKKNCTTKLTS